MIDPPSVPVPWIIVVILDRWHRSAEGVSIADWRLAPDRVVCPVAERLKRCSDQYLTRNPHRADHLSYTVWWLGTVFPEYARVVCLGHWARGNYFVFQDPGKSIDHYTLVLQRYTDVLTDEESARICSNLMFALTERGDFQRAEHFYGQARDGYDRADTPAVSWFRQRLAQNYGWLLHNRGAYQDAIEQHTAAYTLAAQLGSVIGQIEPLVNQSISYKMVGAEELALRTLFDAYALAQDADQSLTIARIEMNIGDFYGRMGVPAEALRWFDRARAGFVHANTPMELGSVALYEAELLERLGASRLAFQSYERALEQFLLRTLYEYQVGNILTRMGALERENGHWPEATALLTDAVELWQRLGNRTWEESTRLELAFLALEQQPAATLLDQLPPPRSLSTPLLQAQYAWIRAECYRGLWQQNPSIGQSHIDTMLATYQSVAAFAEGAKHLWLQRKTYLALGQVYRDLDPMTADSYFHRVQDLDDQIRASLTIQELKASYLQFVDTGSLWLATSALETGRFDETFRHLQHAKGAALQELISQRSEPSLVHEALRRQIHRRRLQLQTLAEQERQSVLDMERSDATLTSLEYELYHARKARTGSTSSDPHISRITPAQLPGTLLEYFVCNQRLYGLRVDPDGTMVGHDLGVWDTIQPQIHSLVAMCRTALPRGSILTTPPIDARLRRRLEELYRVLLGPFGTIPAHTELLIAPCPGLYDVPFAALRVEDACIIQHHAIRLIPSPALIRTHAPQQHNGDVVVVADSVDGALPHIDAEINAIQKAFPEADVSLNPVNTINKAWELSVAPRVLHIATHTIVREDVPLLSALRVGDMLLSVEELFELPLNGTDLVCLSGCSTASGTHSGGALLAFQTAALVAGAQHVLSTLWELPDVLAPLVMDYFYQAYAAGLSPSAALQVTQKQLLQNERTAHPALWASWVCMGR